MTRYDYSEQLGRMAQTPVGSWVPYRDHYIAMLDAAEDLQQEKQKVAELEKALEEVRSELKYTIAYYD